MSDAKGKLVTNDGDSISSRILQRKNKRKRGKVGGDSEQQPQADKRKKDIASNSPKSEELEKVSRSSRKIKEMKFVGNEIPTASSQIARKRFEVSPPKGVYHFSKKQSKGEKQQPQADKRKRAIASNSPKPEELEKVSRSGRRIKRKNFFDYEIPTASSQIARKRFEVSPPKGVYHFSKKQSKGEKQQPQADKRKRAIASNSPKSEELEKVSRSGRRIKRKIFFDYEVPTASPLIGRKIIEVSPPKGVYHFSKKQSKGEKDMNNSILKKGGQAYNNGNEASREYPETGPRYECPQVGCGMKFRKLNILKMHLERKHPNLKVKCGKGDSKLNISDARGRKVQLKHQKEEADKKKEKLKPKSTERENSKESQTEPESHNEDSEPTRRTPEDESRERGKRMIARTKTGHLVEIIYDEDRPEDFSVERARIVCYKSATLLKDYIESDKFYSEASGNQIRRMLEEKLKNRSEKEKLKLKWLKIDARIVEIDASIKSSLNMKNADCDRCLLLLDELSQLSVAPLMLKKHPEMVDTIKKLQKYCGNFKEWNMTEDEKVLFTSKTEKIQVKASFIYRKFKSLFTVPEGKKFQQVFEEKVSKFRNVTRQMKPDEVSSLLLDPTDNVTKHAGSSPGIQLDEEGTKDKGGEKIIMRLRMHIQSDEEGAKKG